MNDQTSCSIVREKLPLYVGGDLDPDGQELVRSHLDGCGDCARDAAAAAHARDVFRTHLRRETQERGASDGALSSTEARSAASLWDGVRAELVREGRILTEVTLTTRAAEGARADSAPAVPAGRVFTGRFGGRIAVAAALLLGIYLGPRLLDEAPAPTGMSGGEAGLAVSPASQGFGGGPSLVQAPAGSGAEAELHPLERGLKPLLREDPDLLRDAQPLLYRMPVPPGTPAGESQLAGYSGGAVRRQGKLR